MVIRTARLLSQFLEGERREPMIDVALNGILDEAVAVVDLDTDVVVVVVVDVEKNVDVDVLVEEDEEVVVVVVVGEGGLTPQNQQQK